MKRFIIVGLLIATLITACRGATELTGEGRPLDDYIITVYKPPT